MEKKILRRLLKNEKFPFVSYHGCIISKRKRMKLMKIILAMEAKIHWTQVK